MDKADIAVELTHSGAVGGEAASVGRAALCALVIVEHGDGHSLGCKALVLARSGVEVAKEDRLEGELARGARNEGEGVGDAARSVGSRSLDVILDLGVVELERLGKYDLGCGDEFEVAAARNGNLDLVGGVAHNLGTWHSARGTP